MGCLLGELQNLENVDFPRVFFFHFFSFVFRVFFVFFFVFFFIFVFFRCFFVFFSFYFSFSFFSCPFSFFFSFVFVLSFFYHLFFICFCFIIIFIIFFSFVSALSFLFFFQARLLSALQSSKIPLAPDSDASLYLFLVSFFLLVFRGANFQMLASDQMSSSCCCSGKGVRRNIDIKTNLNILIYLGS